jgi:PHP family Zn ribbon phosphoesterase
MTKKKSAQLESAKVVGKINKPPVLDVASKNLPASSSNAGSKKAEENQSKTTKSLSAKIVKSTTKGKSYTVDLRISSPTSLGHLGIEGIDTAPALVRLAKVKRLDIIAVTDFYHGGFVDRLRRAAENSVVTVLPGVVIRTSIPECNEVVLVCVFPQRCGSVEIGSVEIEQFLRELEVPESAAHDSTYIVAKELDEVLILLEKWGAAAIPSRMDQTPYRKLAIKALIERYGFRAFDLAHPETSREFFNLHWSKVTFQFLSFSNAAALAQIGSRSSKVRLAEPGFAGVRQLTERTVGKS